METTDPSLQGVAGPRTVLRVLEILRLVASRPEGWTLTEIVTDLALPKTSAFSLLRTLEGGGYLNHEDGRYTLGREAFKLGASLYQATSFPRSVRPILEELAQSTGETVMLGVLSDEGDEVCYIDVIESEAPLRFTVRTGNRRPVYSVAAGKILLAYQSEAEQEAYLARTTFIRFTTDTSGKAELRRIIREARERAVVMDANGIIDGAAADVTTTVCDSGTTP